MRRFIAAFMSVVMIAGYNFVYAQSNVTSQVVKAYASNAAVSECGGWYESAYIIWDNDANAENAKVYYKKSDDTVFTQIDSELIRKTANGGRADIVGISAGTYDIKVETSDGVELVQNNISVAAHDRSGYAHFNYTSGVGAYNDDGTPKADADIIYVTNENKNTVKYNGMTGIAQILQSGSNLKNPLIVRIIGTVDTQTRDADGSKTTDINNGVVAINGLQDNVLNNDSYFNMLDADTLSNVTVEGIGTDATIEKWGFTFKKSSSIEVRNLHFTKYPEDACSFIGRDKTNCYNIWLHNCTFDVGENKYDLTDEQDKHEGDGSTDIVMSQFVTISYNRFNNCHKTSLNGNNNDVMQYNITWHHNYFNKSGSRMPLIRQANMHSYNNYFYGGNKCIDARANAWILSEANYFEKCTNALITRNITGYGHPIIKSYNDVFVNSAQNDEAGTIYITNDRTATYEVPSNENPYPNFDTNPAVFYYKDGKSNVLMMQTAEEAKQTCINHSGVMTAGSDVPIVQPTVETTTEATTETVKIETKTPVESVMLDSSASAANGENSVTYRPATDDYLILDRSTNATTIWEVPFDTQTSGTVIISGRVTPSSAASKWAFLQIRGKTAGGAYGSIAALASNADKLLCLKPNDADFADYAKTSYAIGANNQYNYTFVIDLDNKTATLKFNGITVSSKVDVSEISSVYFMTAKADANRDIIATLPTVGKAVPLGDVQESTTEVTTATETTTEATTETTTAAETTTSAPPVDEHELPGDVNTDGNIDAADAAMALQYTLNKAAVDISDIGLKNADVDRSYEIDAADAAAILQKALVSTFEFNVKN